MKKIISRIVFSVGIILISLHSNAATTFSSPATENIIPAQSVLDRIATMKVKDIQKLAGRKLTLKEKVVFWLLKEQIKHKADKGIVSSVVKKILEKKTKKTADYKKGEGATSNGQTAFVFGVFAVGLFIAGLFLPYVILGSLIAAILAIVLGSVAKKENPSDAKAGAAKLMGWITLGLIALLLILAVVVLASIFN